MVSNTILIQAPSPRGLGHRPWVASVWLLPILPSVYFRSLKVPINPRCPSRNGHCDEPALWDVLTHTCPALFKTTPPSNQSININNNFQKLSSSHFKCQSHWNSNSKNMPLLVSVSLHLLFPVSRARFLFSATICPPTHSCFSSHPLTCQFLKAPFPPEPGPPPFRGTLQSTLSYHQCKLRLPDPRPDPPQNPRTPHQPGPVLRSYC